MLTDSIDRKYRRSINTTVGFFKENDEFRVWSQWVSLWSARYRSGSGSNSGKDINFYTNSKAWRWSTVFNAANKYLGYCEEFGITKPHNGIRIVASSSDGSSSAPMLSKTWGFVGFDTKSSVADFLINSTGIPFSLSIIGFMTKFVQPDIIICTNASKGTDKVTSVTFHELAHASHCKEVGSGYWLKYVNYIITYGKNLTGNGFYGDGTGENAGYCGVGELWGYYFEAVCMNKYDPSKTVRIQINEDYPRDWFNPGFLWHVDNISDVTTTEIFDCIKDADINTINKFKNKLKTKTYYDYKIDNAYNMFSDWSN